MPVITVSLLEGRDAQTKGQLITALTDAYDSVCGGGDKLYVVIDEVKRDNWGVGGKQLSTMKKPPPRGDQDGIDQS